MRKVFSLLLALLLVSSMSVTAFAARSKITYNGTGKSFSIQPGSEYTATDLFDSFKDVMPGDTLTEQIQIENHRSNKVKIKVYMRSQGAQQNTDDFLSQMNLTVRQRGDSILFDAPADMTAQLTDWTYLGTIYSGGKITLDLTLEVPITMGNEYQHNIGYIDWEFMVEELPIDPSDPTPPKTGDIILAYAAVMVISLTALVVLFLFFKRKKKKDETK